ncbi:MAG: hypothetical protein ACREQD_07270 [Candidatus Binataceae bacterium]
MQAVFVELPALERNRARYLDDDSLRQLQIDWMANPTSGDVIEYDKDEAADLTPKERAALKERVKAELKARSKA